MIKKLLLIFSILFLFSNTIAEETFAAESKREQECKINSPNDAQVRASESGNKCGCFYLADGEQTKMYDNKGVEVAYCVQLQETLFHKNAVSGKNGIELVSNYIYLAYKYGASIIGIICVFIIITSGVQISTAGATGDAESAKERIWSALLSLLLLFGSGLILKTVNPGFFI